MRIIESKIEGKSPEICCEDELFVSDDFVAVIDGVTSKTDFIYNGCTSGKLAAICIKEALTEAKRADSCKDIIERCNNKIRRFYTSVAFPYDKSQKGLQAAMVMYSDYYREIWLIGDCQVKVDGEDYMAPKKSDLIISEFRALLMELNLSAEDARRIIEPWILKSTVFANDESSEYGYSVINGEPIPENLVKKIRMDSNCHELILASDGYPYLKSTLEESEKELELLLKEDPGCHRKFLSTKGLKSGNTSFDDRTYIRFEI